MALDRYDHGVRVSGVSDGTRVIRTISTAIIGIVATASDANAETFPLNQPALVTNVATAIGNGGDTGTLKNALNAIGSQAKPIIVVVRVAKGEDENDASANVIGTTLENGQNTGLQALMTAKQKKGVTTRIINCPDLDTQEVATAMVSVLQSLRAFGYVYVHGCETITDATTYRDQFGARELMVIWPQFQSFNTDTAETASTSPVAVALGMRAKLDQDIGWHKTISDVTTLINQAGFRFWGSRT